MLILSSVGILLLPKKCITKVYHVVSTRSILPAKLIRMIPMAFITPFSHYLNARQIIYYTHSFWILAIKSINNTGSDFFPYYFDG